MAATYQLYVATPENKFFDGETSQIVVRTTTGDVGVLARHESLVAILKPGRLKILSQEGDWKVADAASGILKVNGKKVTVLTDSAEWVEEETAAAK
jgi:F-type H+-transporting ATPase subunit epsilon